MKIKSIRIKNFRSLKDIKVDFEEGLTCIVGENDAGKTSLLNCIMMFSEINTYNVKIDDFYKAGESNEIEVELELSDGTNLLKKFRLESDNRITPEIKTYYPKVEFEKEFSMIKQSLGENLSISLQDLSDSGIRNNLDNLYKKLFGQNPRNNLRIDRILSNIEQKLQESSDQIETKNEHRIYVYYLDNRRIESPSETIKELFFKDIGRNIWNAQVNEQGKTIREILNEKLEEIKNETEKSFNEILSQKVSEFLGERVELKTDISLRENPINTEIKVNFVDKTNNEVSFENKGDGTKRRITMALIEFKLEKTSNTGEKDVNIFIFDEPDTHLHIEAQRKLIKKLKTYSKNKQIILTTHSPFIINLLNPSQIRAFSLNKEENEVFTKVQVVRKDKEIDRLLKMFGIENMLLFFARKIVITEEKSFKRFLEHLYSNLYEMQTYGDLIHIIEGDGIYSPFGFAKILIDELKYDKDNIIVVVDKDISEHTTNENFIKIKEITEELKSKGWNKERNYFEVGKYKEFEDAFEPEVIYAAWKSYLENNGQHIPENWTFENVKRAYEQCSREGKKLREKLKSLNSGGRIEFSHTENFPKALAEYCSQGSKLLPEQIQRLLDRLKEE